ncbi:MAG: hypothetical protein ACTTJW_01275 [Sphaerochaeta sp.]
MEKDQISIGSAQCLIDIKLPVILNGHINRNKPANGFIDHPEIHAICIHNFDKPILIISIDLLEIDTLICSKIRKTISDKLKIPVSCIMIACTHSHTVPSAFHLGLVNINYEFVNTLEQQLLDISQEAFNEHVYCTMQISAGLCEGIGINRRKIENSQVVMAPNPEGSNDSYVKTFWFLNIKKEPIACLVNFNMHPTTLDVSILKVSADYPLYMRKEINNYYKKCNILFLNGACGDIRPNLIHEDGGFRGGFEKDLIEIGGKLGRAVINSLRNSIKEDLISIQTRTKKIMLNLDYEAKDKKTTRVIRSNSSEGRQINQELMHKAFSIWDTWIKEMYPKTKPSKIPFEIQTISFSKKTALVALPGEIFIDSGHNITRKSPFSNTIVVGYSNGSVGYIPTSEAIEQGGYEIDDAYKLYFLPAPFVKNTAEQIEESSVDLLKEIYYSIE